LPYGFNEKLPFIYADAAGCGKPFSYFSANSDKEKSIEDKCDIVNDRIMTETFIQDFILAKLQYNYNNFGSVDSGISEID